MRTGFWTLLLASLAVALAIVLHQHGGNVLILVPPWRIELSLTLAVLLGLALLLGLHLILRLLGWLARSPQRLRSWRDVRTLQRDHALLESSWISVLEGRVDQAQKDLSKYLARAPSAERRVLAALALARVQHHAGHTTARDQSLEHARTAANTPRLRALNAVATAAMLLDHGSTQDALALLQPLQDASARDPYASRLLLQAHRQLEDHDQIHALARLLWRRGILEKAQALAVIEVSVAARLAACDVQGFKAMWGALKSEERTLPAVALQAATILRDQDNEPEAARILEAAIAAHDTIHPQLLAAYVQCAPEHIAHRLSRAEGWLKAHPDHPDLLAALGNLCLIGQLWGQGERYLLRSLRLRQDPRVSALLGNLYDRIGRTEDAVRHWRLAASVGLPALSLVENHMLPAADTRSDPSRFDADACAQEDAPAQSYPIPTTPPLEGKA